MNLPHDPTKRRLFQFGTKQLFVLMVIVSILSVPFGMLFRSLPPEKRDRALFAILVACGIAGIAIAVVFVRRLRAERIAGALRLRTPTAGTMTYHVLNFISCLGLIAFFGYLLNGYVHSSLVVERLAPNLIWPAVMWIGAVATYLVSYWWCGIDPTRIEFCEHAVIQSAIHVLPWKECRGYRWGSFDNDALFLLLDGRQMKLTVPAEFRERVREAIPESVPENP